MVASFSYSIVILLIFLIKFLFVIFFVGLIGGLLVVAKNYILTHEDIENFKSTFKSEKKVTSNTCSVCGKEINLVWKACPYCGATIEKEEK